MLMGSSMRDVSRPEDLCDGVDAKEVTVDSVIIFDESRVVAEFCIANFTDDIAAIEQDARFVEDEYKYKVPGCPGSVTELNLEGPLTYCWTANVVFESFSKAQE